MRERGIAILITDHQVRETLEITDRSYVIRSGQVLCHGDRREVLANPEARKIYFGDSPAVPLPPPHALDRRRRPRTADADDHGGPRRDDLGA